MPNLRLMILLVVSLALGALAWFDHQMQSEDASVTRSENAAQSAEPSVAGAQSAEHAGTDDAGEVSRMDASDYAAAPKNAENSMSNPLSAIDLNQMRDTVDRPLFASSRRRPPESASKTASAAAPAQVPTFELLGVALGGPRPIAILRKKSDSTTYRVQIGDILSGWQVAKVEARTVLLERQDGVSESIPLLRQ